MFSSYMTFEQFLSFLQRSRMYEWRYVRVGDCDDELLIRVLHDAHNLWLCPLGVVVYMCYRKYISPRQWQRAASLLDIPKSLARAIIFASDKNVFDKKEKRLKAMRRDIIKAVDLRKR